MFTEGIGKHPPSPIAVGLSRKELRLLREEAIEREAFRRYSRRKDSWGQGMIGTLSGDITEIIGGSLPAGATPVLIGLAGEWSTASHINNSLGTTLGVDVIKRKNGDGDTDLQVNGLKIQVKTKRYLTAPNLVRCKNQSGWSVPIHAAVFVFCQWNFTETGTLLGCIGAEEMKALRQEQSPRGHWNYVIGDDDLLPMGRLITELRGRA